MKLKQVRLQWLVMQFQLSVGGWGPSWSANGSQKGEYEVFSSIGHWVSLKRHRLLLSNETNSQSNCYWMLARCVSAEFGVQLRHCSHFSSRWDMSIDLGSWKHRTYVCFRLTFVDTMLQCVAARQDRNPKIKIRPHLAPTTQSNIAISSKRLQYEDISWLATS